MPNVALFDFFFILPHAIVYFYICIQYLFISVAYFFYIWIPSLLISIVYFSFLFYIRSLVFTICSFLLYMFRCYSIFNHLYLITNDLYAIVFHYNRLTIQWLLFIFQIFPYYYLALYNSDLYSIFSYLYPRIRSMGMGVYSVFRLSVIPSCRDAVILS